MWFIKVIQTTRHSLQRTSPPYHVEIRTVSLPTSSGCTCLSEVS